VSQPDPLVVIANVAASYVRDGDVVGLGSGRAATAFVEALGEKVQKGLKVRGIPTSQATVATAKRVGIPLIEPVEAGTIDIAVDGADDVDPALNLVKGKGGALIRERLVASVARRFVILVGADKVVQALGRTQIPVEVVPFGHEWTKERLHELGLKPSLRVQDGKPFVTDNGNLIYDSASGPIAAPTELSRVLDAIPGVVGHGLFLGMASEVIVGYEDRYDILKPDAAS
jgi:ribose 5-phosphate isomerase A